MENYVEEIVEEWLKFKGYITIRDVPIWKKANEKRKQGQWGDIDVIGIKKGEVVIVECKEFLGTKTIKKWAEETPEDFTEAINVLTNKVDNKGIPIPEINKDDKIIKYLIAAQPMNIESYKERLLPYNIEVKHFKEVINEILTHLISIGVLEGPYGKHSKYVRFFVTLMKYGLLQIE